MRRRFAGAVVGMVLVLAVLLLPGSLLATLSPAEKVASFGLELEIDRLQAVREQLVRRQAWQRALETRSHWLGDELQALQLQAEQLRVGLQDARAEAATLERRLDHLVPRLLARGAVVGERREQVGRLLADLASGTRQVELDGTVRARLLAISPVLLQRLRSAEARLALLEQQPDPALARRSEIERRVAALMAEGERLQRQREQIARQRAATVARLAQLDAEVGRLEQEQRALGQRLLMAEAAHVVRAGPKANQPALPNLAGRSAGELLLDAATIKGVLPAQARAGFAAAARQPAAAQLVAVAPESLELPASLTAARAELSTVPPLAKPLDFSLEGDLAAAHAPFDGTSAATPLDVAFLQAVPLADEDARAVAVRLPPALTPIMPVPGEAMNPFGEQGGAGAKPGLTIAAAPGQAVAAPEAGRVVFAGAFRSYGKLLIIEHQREYHTLLWGFSELDVEKGDRVRTGQIVGVVASDAERSPELHVELRRNGRPVNPLPWLAASSNKVRG